MSDIVKPTTKSIAPIKAQITKASNKAVELTKIENDEQEKHAVELLTIVKSNAKIIKAEKEKFLKPLKELQTATNDLFRPIENTHKDTEAHLKGLLGEYATEKQRKMEEEERALQERMRTEEMKPSEVVEAMSEIKPEKTEPIRSNKGSVSYRTTYRAVIENVDMIPKHYFVLDENWVSRDAIEAHKKGQAIPGVKVIEEKGVSVRV